MRTKSGTLIHLNAGLWDSLGTTCTLVAAGLLSEGTGHHDFPDEHLPRKYCGFLNAQPKPFKRLSVSISASSSQQRIGASNASTTTHPSCGDGNSIDGIDTSKSRS